MTAVIYARYSTDSQREESIEGQIRECTAYAEKNGFTVVKHYIDRAVSAKTDNRPQFQQMIKDSERGMTENALKGIYNGGTIPFGYMIDETRHYQPDLLLAPYVEQTFQKYADGATMTDLRDWLKAHNIKNSMGGEMSYNTIQRMLSNRRYIGELRLRDVVQPNAIPALVSGELVGVRPLHLAAQDRSVA